MADSPIVTREAFDAAIIHGDLMIVDAFLAQPHVRDEIVETNAYIIETAPSDVTTFKRRDGSEPWFRRPKKSSIDTDDVPLLSAARHGHVHVIAWFFSRERAVFMGETLALLLPLVARFDGVQQWYQKKWTSDPLVLETLLTSPVFSDFIADGDQKQSVLDSIARTCQHFELIDVAIAHGARVNKTLRTIARYGTTDCVDQLEQAGAFLVGADLLRPPFHLSHFKHATAFLRRGVDWGNGTAKLLIGAAMNARKGAVDSLLAHGFVDIDARDKNGRTALMHLARVNPWTDLHQNFEDPTPHIAWSLLQYCDVNLVDHRGRTALDFATRENEGVAELLREMGAKRSGCDDEDDEDDDEYEDEDDEYDDDEEDDDDEDDDDDESESSADGVD